MSRSETNALPNAVILFCDDAGYGDFGFTGHPTIATPNLDRMATEGTRFTQFYCANPVCSASSYGLLTGRQPCRSGFGTVLFPRARRGSLPRDRALDGGDIRPLFFGGELTAAAADANFTTTGGSPPLAARWLRWTIDPVGVNVTGCVCYRVGVQQAKGVSCRRDG